MNVVETAIADLLIFEPRVFGDDRGFFMETFRQSWFSDRGLTVDFVQDNHSASMRGVLRGLHYQLRRPQGKLIRVIAGEVFDVAVDLRRQSPTFGQHVAMHLSAANKRMLWIPPGFAHGFLTLSEQAEFVYKCSDYYDSSDERALLWNDPALNIRWPLNGAPSLSEKDKKASPLAAAETFT